MQMYRPTRSGVAIAGAVLLAGAVCAKQGGGETSRDGDNKTTSIGAVIAPPPNVPTPPARTADTNKTDQAKLTRLEHEARALASTDGCKNASACRTAPVGWRGCGGPRTYVVYCAATTDTIAPFRKLKELENAEKAYNAKSGMMSTCEFRMPPTAVLQGGSCREGPARVGGTRAPD